MTEKTIETLSDELSQVLQEIVTNPDEEPKRAVVVDEKTILDYVQRQLSECHSMQTTLGGLDEFFKASVTLLNRSKVKGIQIELTTVKNTLIKINQRKAEYTSYMAEQAQMQKLGIQNV